MAACPLPITVVPAWVFLLPVKTYATLESQQLDFCLLWSARLSPAQPIAVCLLELDMRRELASFELN